MSRKKSDWTTRIAGKGVIPEEDDSFNTTYIADVEQAGEESDILPETQLDIYKQKAKRYFKVNQELKGLYGG
jgi:hypothetical protein